jgi:hypothetical protein
MHRRGTIGLRGIHIGFGADFSGNGWPVLLFGAGGKISGSARQNENGEPTCQTD